MFLHLAEPVFLEAGNILPDWSRAYPVCPSMSQTQEHLSRHRNSLAYKDGLCSSKGTATQNY